MKHKRIGLVVAVELDAVIRKYGKPLKQEKIDAYAVFTYRIGSKKLFVVKSGAGQIGASATTQFCISRLKCDLILNFGIVGGLTEEFNNISNCVVERVIHYDFDTSAVDEGYKVGRYSENADEYIYPTANLVDKAVGACTGLRRVTVASGDKFVGDKEQKDKLRENYGADICEMECAGIVLTCNRNGVPSLSVKCVSDGLASNPSDYYKNFVEASDKCIDILDKVIQTL